MRLRCYRIQKYDAFCDCSTKHSSAYCSKKGIEVCWEFGSGGSTRYFWLQISVGRLSFGCDLIRLLAVRLISVVSVRFGCFGSISPSQSTQALSKPCTRQSNSSPLRMAARAKPASPSLPRQPAASPAKPNQQRQHQVSEVSPTEVTPAQSSQISGWWCGRAGGVVGAACGGVRVGYGCLGGGVEEQGGRVHFLIDPQM